MYRTNVHDIEQFLYHEADLLDSFRFREWFSLFSPDGSYLVPSTDTPQGDPAATLFLINDDYRRLGGRVERMCSPDAHAGFPLPRTRRLITNVRAVDDGADVVVRSNFAVHVFRNGQRHDFIGRYTHRLTAAPESGPGGYLIRQRRADLDLESLAQAGGKINIII